MNNTAGPSSPPLAVVSISGGKDSTASALLAIAAYGRENCRLVFADTGNEHALTMEYVHDYLPVALGLPVQTVKADFADKIAAKRVYIRDHWPGKGVPDATVKRALSVLQPTGVPFLDLCLWKNRFPSRRAQFCTQELKRYPLDNAMLDLLGQGYRLESWRGVRRDESQARAQVERTVQAAEGWVIQHPVVDWSAVQVVDYLKAHGIKLNPLYRLGMGRVGCMPCINCNKSELAEIARRFPEHIDKIREWEAVISDATKRGFATFFVARWRKPKNTITNTSTVCVILTPWWIGP